MRAALGITRIWMLGALTLIAALFLCMGDASAQITALDGAPAGFEQLETPRPAQVDVTYGNEPLGSFAAHVTPTSLRFDDPAALVAAVPAIKDKPGVSAALSQPLPVNAAARCTVKRVEDCGTLTPDIAGVIYDESRLAAELFLNPAFLSVVDTSGARYLPLPERKFSSVYGFTGAVSGVDTQAPTFALTNTSVFSVGEARLDTQTSVTSEGLRFDTAAATIERQGWSASGGLFQSRAMQLLSDRDIAGVSVSTSRKTVLDARKSEGNAVILYLARRSFVSIYRDGRLYSSRSYEAGNQQVDTAELPEGAYDITLKIQEQDGTVREEKRFYVKNFDLPPAGEPVYWAQAGLIRETAEDDAALPKFTGDPLLSVGTVRRVSDQVGVSASVLGLKDRAVVETGALFIEDSVQARASGLASTKGDLGVGGGVLYSKDRFTTALDARYLVIHDTPLPGYDDITESFAQVSLTSSYAVRDDLTVGLRGSYSRQKGAGVTSSIGPYAEWQIWQEGESMIGLSADAAQIDGQVQGSVFVNFSYRFGQSGVSGTMGSGFGKRSGGAVGSARVWHDDPTPGNALRVSAGVSGDKDTQAISADAEWRNQVGQFAGSVQQSFGKTSNFNYGGNFAVGVAQSEDEVRIGGSQNDTSAVMVETAGDAKAEMRIFVNDAERGTVAVGGRQVIYLTPFQTYRIRLAPKHPGLLDYLSGDRKVTLYPGNVVKLHWDVNPFQVVSARIVDASGAALANALLQESRDAIATDAEGRIQAELSKPSRLTFALAGGGTCSVTLPAAKAPAHGVLVYRQPLTCAAEMAR